MAIKDGFSPPRMTPYGAPYRAPEDTKAKVRAHARETIRRFGELTAPLRADPDYLVIGTKRGGTTSMAKWLLEHPDVSPLFPARETRKGTYYFDVNYERGENWYKSHFPTRAAMKAKAKKAGRPVLVGEATPYYLHSANAAKRAYEAAPDAKIVALLRDPVDRAFSHWTERTRNNVETLSFEDALAAEPERLDGEEARMLADPSYVSFAHQHFSYIDQGRYARGLKRWFEAYPRDQILVIRSEDMYEDPAKIFGETLDFLGLESYEPKAFSAWNMKPKDPVAPAATALLKSALADDILELEELLGRKMQWQ